MKHLVLIFITSSILTSSVLLPFHDCNCTIANNETTFWGDELIVSTKGDKVKVIRGIVLDPLGNEPMNDVLVEVFDNPNVANMNVTIEERKKLQNRIVACKTTTSGEFCFDNIPKGKYEVRFSKRDFKTLSVITLVNSKYKSTKQGIKIMMSVGT